MTTTYQYLHNMLIDNGMFDSQAHNVMRIAIPKIEALVSDYHISWLRSYTEYPLPMFTVWRIVLFNCAYEWCNEHASLAWFKDAFKQ